jgi:hypothetical protein
MLKTSVSLILVIAVALLIFVKTHSAQDIPVEKLKPRWASSASSFVNIAGLILHIRDEGTSGSPTL